jgi:acetyl/propionyl-CoA carboxylase alpha subunit/acetyl-CoA carboxylase carboxyltransferase component
MSLKKLLIANRGEIAIRIARAAAGLGIATVVLYSEDDAQSLHTKAADEARVLKGVGAAAYLDIEQIVALAKEAGCDAVHPGYGFLSENAAFARALKKAGIKFVGPNADALELFGDKVQARALAERACVPLLPGTKQATSLEDTRKFMKSLGEGGAIMIKAIAGGGGRGMRPVHSLAEIDEAYARCQSEAKAAFGSGDVYVERLIQRARHVEIQIVGDGKDVVHLYERECSMQRRNQKVVEIAPSPSLTDDLRSKLTDAAVKLAREAKYDSLGTFEFLVDTQDKKNATFAFMEANPRLQVEHTVTEEVTGIDLVQTQLLIASGKSLKELGLEQSKIGKPEGYAIQLRINMETMDAEGNTKPSGGTLAAFEAPSGPGTRVDTYGYAGYRTNPNFDSLLAKLITWSRSANYADAVAKSYRALNEFRIAGVATNVGFLQNVLRNPDFAANNVYTRFIEDNIGKLVNEGADAHRKIYFDSKTSAHADAGSGDIQGPAGTAPLKSPMQGKVVSLDVVEGDSVARGQQIAILESMKMEHIVKADVSGIIRMVAVQPGETLFEGHPLFFVEEREVKAGAKVAEEKVDLDHIRPALAEVNQRHAYGFDENRPDAVEKRRKTNQRTARENVNDLVDPDSFIEYGALAIAAQRRRRTVEDLIVKTPADGLITGIGSINGSQFPDDKSRAVVMAYDYTVLAGTQGVMNHRKKDRILDVAIKSKLPVVLFAEGGGGRPGDTDFVGVAGIDVMTFNKLAELSGMVPRVGIVSGRCFAGNAALLGICDTIIATEFASIGMAGPAMIEGGGLGVYHPDEVGPTSKLASVGAIDIRVADEAEAVAVTKKYLSYFQGSLPEWKCADQRQLRHVIPENRLRSYDMRKVIEILVDTDSVLEIRRDYAPGIITCLVRIEGHPFGLIANNPTYLGGAVNGEGGHKAARFMQLCDAFDIPMISLCDTPGFMVGPDAEQTGQLRHVARMFVTGANMTVPVFSVVTRKAYGLGAQGMLAGSTHAPFFTVAWPTGEFGAMGIEGNVRLGFRKELEAVEDLAEREKLFQKMVAGQYEFGKAINMAAFLEIDDVIDPLETRRWIIRGLKSQPAPVPREGKKRPFIDTF